ncbi:MAG: hypothetical protein ABI461_00235 [Polyangiaceae bacterium]
MVVADEVRAVVDIDSPFVAAFSEAEGALLEKLVAEAFDRADVIW